MNPNEPLTQLGRYQLKRVIGRGAMGLVYEGLDPRLERAVAVKTILKSHLLDEAMAGEYSARFVREAQAAGRLNHPNIVTVFDFGQQDDVAYLVMEFIRGRELAAHFEDDDYFDLPQAVRIVGELLDALGYAHERGIVHRDVKPANVMIETGGRVKLTDFGVARLAEANVDRTMPGTMVGTPSYMSPEQIQGLPVGSRTDLFAAGVVLYQFLTRQKPFTGGGQWTVQRKIVHDDPVWPSMANQAVPPVFDAIMRRALAKSPEDRYPTAAEFAADLRRALGAAPLWPAPAALPEFDPDATVLRPPTRAPSATAAAPAHGIAATAVSAATAAPVTQPLADVPGPSPVPAYAPESVPVPAAPVLPPAPPSVPPTPSPPTAAPDRNRPSLATPPVARSAGPWVWGGSALAAALLLGAAAWNFLPGTGQMPVSAPPAGGGYGDASPRIAGQAVADTPAATPAVQSPDLPAAPTMAIATPPAAKRASEQAVTSTTRVDPAAMAPAVPPAVTPALTSPPRALAPRPETRTAAQRPAATPDARCGDLVQRLLLGETLSPESSEFFQKECRR